MTGTLTVFPANLIDAITSSLTFASDPSNPRIQLDPPEGYTLLFIWNFGPTIVRVAPESMRPRARTPLSVTSRMTRSALGAGPPDAPTTARSRFPTRSCLAPFDSSSGPS